MQEWLEMVRDLLPGTLPAVEYLERTAAAARSAGFHPSETLPLVASCRDELMSQFVADVDGVWGPPFLIGSLGGLVLTGVSGIGAAVGHAPDRGLRHFVAYVMAHVGIDSDGTPGRVRRPGQAHPSTACGALTAFLAEVRSGGLRLEYDRLDPEMSLLRTRLAPALLSSGVPDLLGLTALARDVALADLTEIGGMTGPGRGTVSVFTGIVVHGPDGADYVAPSLSEVRFPRHEDHGPTPLRW
jgi:hypothetical protein